MNLARVQAAAPLSASAPPRLAPLGTGVYRVAVRVLNQTEPLPSATDYDGELRSLASTHVLLGAREGEFVSLLDPPEARRELAEGCRNIGAWPILVGDPGDRDIMLCSPIILYDYPAVAPESPGDFFDATEIDEMLALRILTLSAQEREEAASFDPRVRALLARTEAMSPAEMARLHGAKRRAGHGGGSRPHAPRDQVRLCPKGRADVFDLALAGQIATIASIEEDVDQRVFVTVTLDDDPGRDLGLLGQPGHRFFFRLDEIESKIDLLPYVPFDLDRCLEFAREVNPRLRVFQLSALTGEGTAAWYRWIREEAM